MAEGTTQGNGPANKTVGLDVSQLAELLGSFGNEEVPKAEKPEDEPTESEPSPEEVPQEEPKADETQPEAAGEEPTGEEQEEGDGESSESEDEAAEDTGNQADPIGVQKRLDKLTKRAKSAEERAEQAEGALGSVKAELEQLRAKLSEIEQQADGANAPTPVSPESPLANIWSESELDKKLQEVRQVRRWCERYPEGTVIKDGEQEIEYTAEQIREMRFRAEDILEVHAPERRRFLQAHQSAEEKTVAQFPWWKDRAHPDYARAQEILRTLPEIKRLPHWKFITGVYVMGLKALETQETGKKEVRQAPKPVRQPSKPAASPQSVNPQDAKAKAARERLLKNRDVDSLAEAVKTMF
jgi:hypothetical protein